MKGRRVLFEPWSMGDALIAASAFRLETSIILACHPRWHSVLKIAYPGLELLPVELAYTLRGKKSPSEDSATVHPDVQEVLSIRGDFRDYRAASRIFPNAKISMTGWVSFVARRVSIVDLPYAMGWRRVRNRYDAWAEILGHSVAKLPQPVTQKPSAENVAIHVGAQWRSKQYPWVRELVERLRERSKSVRLLKGPGDFVPEGMREGDFETLVDGPLCKAFQESSVVITNDSGPMHLAAALGCSVVAIASQSNLREWLPPGVEMLCSEKMPRGYHPTKNYQSDDPGTEWPAVGAILNSIKPI